MNGLFLSSETNSTTRPEGRVVSCISCGLCKNCMTPKMPLWGKGKKGILIIGEFPGRLEDKKGTPWQGKEGVLLKKTLKRLGIDLEEDCFSINAVSCHVQTKEGVVRRPTSVEVTNCRKIVLGHIDKQQPKLIILLGIAAVQSVIGYRWKKDLGAITKWRGWTIPDRDFKCWICPTFAPDHVERLEKEAETIWKNDLECFIEKLQDPFPTMKYPKIEFIEDLSPLSSIESRTIAFDYETTGLKPHAKGHRIICAAVAINEQNVYSFLMPKTRQERKPFIDLLQDMSISKIASNMKYEDTWTEVRLKSSVVNWEWDTMLAAHVLDNRRNITSLKFQMYIHFGVVDYDSDVSSYLKSPESNGLNKILDFVEKPEGVKKLLTYCALDAVYEYRLATLQQKLMGWDPLPF